MIRKTLLLLTAFSVLLFFVSDKSELYDTKYTAAAKTEIYNSNKNNGKKIYITVIKITAKKSP